MNAKPTREQRLLAACDGDRRQLEAVLRLLERATATNALHLARASRGWAA